MSPLIYSNGSSEDGDDSHEPALQEQCEHCLHGRSAEGAAPRRPYRAVYGGSSSPPLRDKARRPPPAHLELSLGNNSRLDTGHLGVLCFRTGWLPGREVSVHSWGVLSPQQSGRRPGVLSRIYTRAFLQTLAIAWTLSGALVLSEPPLLAFAAATYTVESNVDAHKDGTFPAVDCRSTLTPDHPCTLRAAIETANTASSGAAINVPGNLVITLDATLGELSPNVPMSITSTGRGSAVVDGRLQ